MIEKVLEAAIVQYIDVLMGITNQRKEVFNMNQKLSMESMTIRALKNGRKMFLKNRIILVFV